MLTSTDIIQLINTWLQQWFSTLIINDEEFNVSTRILIVGTPISIEIVDFDKLSNNDVTPIYVKIKDENCRRTDYDVHIQRDIDLASPETNVDDIIFKSLKIELKIIYNKYRSIADILKVIA